MIGKVECSIRLYGVLAGLGVCYLMAGGCRWHVAKTFLGPAEVQPNEFGGRRALTAEVLVRFLGGAKYWQQSRLPFRRPAIVSQEGKLINFDIVNPLSKSNGGRGRMFTFGGL